MKKQVKKAVKMAELKQCPFCNFVEELKIGNTEYTGMYYVQCMYCDAKGPEEYTKQAAVSAWNKRS